VGRLLLLTVIGLGLVPGCQDEDRGAAAPPPRPPQPDQDAAVPDVAPEVDARPDAAPTCVPSNGGVEACNSVDDDCDAETDEDFDLDTDVENCGACGNACALPNAESACVDGECVLVACFEDTCDVDGVAEKGCEVQRDGAVVYVDDDAVEPGCGTEDWPLATIQAALEVVEEGGMVHVAEGEYRGSWSVETPGCRVVGAGQERTVVVGDQGAAAVRLSADRASLEALGVSAHGLTTGVAVECAADCSLSGIRVIDVGGICREALKPPTD